MKIQELFDKADIERLKNMIIDKDLEIKKQKELRHKLKLQLKKKINEVDKNVKPNR